MAKSYIFKNLSFLSLYNNWSTILSFKFPLTINNKSWIQKSHPHVSKCWFLCILDAATFVLLLFLLIHGQRFCKCVFWLHVEFSALNLMMFTKLSSSRYAVYFGNICKSNWVASKNVERVNCWKIWSDCVCLIFFPFFLLFDFLPNSFVL